MDMISNTLLAKHLSERQGIQILENDHGFIFYKLNQSECFITDMHVDIAERSRGKGRLLINELAEIAKAGKCRAITANVFTWDDGSVNTLTAAFKVGFKIASANNNTITIFKDLTEEA